ncbi:tyrosyl-DNA phosphodiesterase 1 [Rhizophlyctis rosea]|nr:tyrosyl-DNA phosphodiesterase 1 [Rhizophlyctis rosea]
MLYRRTIPIDLVHGLRGESRDSLMEEAQQFPNVRIKMADLPIAYGTHHTKAFFLRYEDNTLHVVIHTANAISRDWAKKTQAVWMSPLLHPKAAGASPCTFEQDLISYLSAYGKFLHSWRDTLSQYDFTPVRAVLIGSTPGRFIGAEIHKWGHMKLRKALQRVSLPDALKHPSSFLVAQFSSIGSLGPTDDWLQNEFVTSLSASTSNQSYLTTRKPPLKLVFPTVENVRTSLEGWAAGNSIPFDSKNWNKQQKYMRPLLHKWHAVEAGRERAMPHIKTFCRVTPEGELAWFLLTSANLSKAAWGSLEKGGAQLMVRSYELGVLVYPELFREVEGQKVRMQNITAGVAKHIPVARETGDGEDERAEEVVVTVRLPYDLPLVPYAKEDETWTWDLPRDQPDNLGRIKAVG